MHRSLDQRLDAPEQATQRRTGSLEAFSAHLRIAYGEAGETADQPLTHEQIAAALDAVYGETDDAANLR
jgi:hypothetical protein